MARMGESGLAIHCSKRATEVSTPPLRRASPSGSDESASSKTRFMTYSPFLCSGYSIRTGVVQNKHYLICKRHPVRDGQGGRERRPLNENCDQASAGINPAKTKSAARMLKSISGRPRILDGREKRGKAR